MTIKTKKYQLETSRYIKVAFQNALRDFWWFWAIPITLIVVGVLVQSFFWWGFWIAISLSILFLLFWWIQFAGVTQLEQTKFMFEKMSYEIDSRYVMLKLNTKKGMPLNWESIKKAKAKNNYFLLMLARAQFIYLPKTIFKTEHDMRVFETILKRKGLFK